MKKITVIDGQGGKMGRAIVEQLKNQFPCLLCTSDAADDANWV